MREQYFTSETIQSISDNLCQSFDHPRRRMRLERFSPRRSALLVLDLQSYFLQPESHACIPSAGAIIPNIQALINAYSAEKMPIIFTRHLNNQKNASNMAVWWRDLITETNPLSVIIPELDTSQGVTLIKNQYDAFYDTALELMLRERRVSQVVICGVMTHLCCETTARSAFIRGFEVFFTIDGTATYTEAHHRAALLNLSHGFATPVLVSELLTACQKDHHAAA